MADFVRLIDVLDKYHENTLIEAIYRGIWKIENNGQKKSHFAVNTWTFSEWGSSGGGRKHFFYDDVETLQILDFVYQWNHTDFNDFFILPSEKKEILGGQRFENYGWFGGFIGRLSTHDKSNQSVNLEVKTLDQLEHSLNPRLVNFSTLLHDSKIHPGMLVEEIIFNGCYKYTQHPHFSSFGPTSVQTAHALAAIGLFVKYSEDDEYWEWLDEDNPLYDFGWPVDKVPKFKWSGEGGYPETNALEDLKTLSSMYKDGLHTVAKLLWLGQATPVQINKALLTQGVWKITALGGSAYLEPSEFVEDNKIQTELHVENLQPALVDYAKPILNGEKPTPELLGLHDGALCKYGWPDKYLPDFASLIENIHPEPTATLKVSDGAVQEVFSKDSKENQPYTPGQDLELSAAKQKGWEQLVMALIAFIRGEVVVINGTDPKTDCSDLQKCITSFFDDTKGIVGLKQTTIDNKFGLANKHRKTGNLPTIRSLANQKKSNSS
jgi:hypothetical protein